MTVTLVARGASAEALIAQRHALGQDARDEVWEGVYHMGPYAHFRHGVLESEMHDVLRPRVAAAGLIKTGAFNLGDDEHNFRVPDLGVHDGAGGVYVATCRLVVEILSPDDETFAKFAFYAAHGVDEILVVDPESRSVRCWRLAEGDYALADGSSVLDVACADLEAGIAWPD